MRNTDPRTWFDVVVGACLGALVAATALFVAVRLIEAVWSALLVILGVGAFIALAVVALRSRRNGW